MQETPRVEGHKPKEIPRSPLDPRVTQDIPRAAKPDQGIQAATEQDALENLREKLGQGGEPKWEKLSAQETIKEYERQFKAWTENLRTALLAEKQYNGDIDKIFTAWKAALSEELVDLRYDQPNDKRGQGLLWALEAIQNLAHATVARGRIRYESDDEPIKDFVSPRGKEKYVTGAGGKAVLSDAYKAAGESFAAIHNLRATHPEGSDLPVIKQLEAFARLLEGYIRTHPPEKPPHHTFTDCLEEVGKGEMGFVYVDSDVRIDMAKRADSIRDKWVDYGKAIEAAPIRRD